MLAIVRRDRPRRCVEGNATPLRAAEQIAANSITIRCTAPRVIVLLCSGGRSFIARAPFWTRHTSTAVC